MLMTKEEIVRKYKESKNKKGYIQTLAELNACDKKYILEILREAEVPLPGNPNFGAKAVIKKPIKTNEAEPTQHTEEQLNEFAEIIEDLQTSEPTEEEPQEEVIEPEKIKIPEEVREQLEEDLEHLENKIAELVNRRVAIKMFLLENS